MHKKKINFQGGFNVVPNYCGFVEIDLSKDQSSGVKVWRFRVTLIFQLHGLEKT